MKQTFAPSSIWTLAHEIKLDKKYGIELGKLKNDQISGIEEIAKKEVIYVKKEKDFSPIIERIKNEYEKIPGYCSMLVKDNSELEKHINTIYQIMYLHYTLGKSENMFGIFPRSCCGYSSSNIQLSLMEKGYPNITRFGCIGHGYIGVPFILEDTKEEGFIIGDPTSDQLWERKGVMPPRNNIFLTKGCKWEYKTDWEDKINLFPMAFTNLEILRKYAYNRNSESNYIKKYFKKVFENPIKLKI